VTTVPSRGRALLLAGVMLLCLIAGSTPRVVGDGVEYVSQAINFSRLDGPSLGRREIPAIEARLAAFNPVLADWRIERATVASSDSRRDFLHFWFYALLAAPVLWVTDAVGAGPPAAFTIVNVVLFGIALFVALPRIGPAGSLLLFGGPIIWWVDKPHTEVFSFALLTIAFALLRDKPWWSLIAAGMAATQYVPMAGVFGLMVAISVVRRRDWLRDWRFLTAIGVGLGLALLHPAYTYLRYRTPSLLLNATTPGMPTVEETTAVLVDPTIGLIGNFPAFLAVVALGVIFVLARQWRELISVEMAVAVVSAVLFLLSFARTTNFHHGATPSMSRYGLWLVPLAVPVLTAAWQHGGLVWRGLLWTTASVSAVICVFAFHPGKHESAGEPTWMASWLWTKHPTWQNPLFEVFSEVMLRREDLMLPAGTAGCEKVLLVGSGAERDVAWPLTCYPVMPPESCRGRGVMCYANRTADGYEFVHAPGRRHGVPIMENPLAWTPAMAAPMRALFDAWGWRGALPPRADLDVLRGALDIQAITVGTSDRFLIVLREPGPAPSLGFRFPGPMTGRLVDPTTGTVLREIDVREPPGALWELILPREALTVLVMKAEPTP